MRMIINTWWVSLYSASDLDCRHWLKSDEGLNHRVRQLGVGAESQASLVDAVQVNEVQGTI